jgi:hypothetical protein
MYRGHLKNVRSAARLSREKALNERHVCANVYSSIRAKRKHAGCLDEITAVVHEGTAATMIVTVPCPGIQMPNTRSFSE